MLGLVNAVHPFAGDVFFNTSCLVIQRAQRFVSRPAALLCLIVGLALALRLYGVGFGLPSLYDPDEPLFALTALKLLKSGSLNPHWFGHPGTTTLYALALIDLIVLGVGLLTGRFASPAAFATAIYADPTVVMLPGRLFMVFCGVMCVILTARLATKLFNRRIGLLAAALLAIMPLHITYSQIIRTDMQASVFILLCCLACVSIVQGGRRRHYVIAAVTTGAAIATKWPSAVVGLCAVAACLCAAGVPLQGRLRNAALVGVGAILALFVISPFLILDYPTLVANLSGEARPFHPGATGGGFWYNLGWYVRAPFLTTLGPVGLAAFFSGGVLAARANTAARTTIVLLSVVFFILISTQALIWSRWLVPILPFAAIFMAVAISAVVDRTRFPRLTLGLLSIAVAVPMLVTTARDAIKRTHDTRTLASAWVLKNVAPGRRIVLEYPAFDLLAAKHMLIYPLGDAGCVDGSKMLRGGSVTYDGAQKHQGKSSNINLGSVAPNRISSCLGDIIILSEYDRYRLEAAHYPAQMANYAALLRASQTVAVFVPKRGETGGPVVRILRREAGQ